MKNPNLVYLVQTDTTVGFLSQDKTKLNFIKKRPLEKPCLKCVPSFKELCLHVRVPKKFKRVVRYSKKSTFFYPNGEALRVVKEPPHVEFLKQFGWMYSTSANESGKEFDKDFAFKYADVVEDEEFRQNAPSKLFCISRIKIRRIR